MAYSQSGIAVTWSAMTQEDGENEGTRGGFLHELGTVILIVALVGGILLFLLGILLASDPLFADSAVLPIMLGLLLAFISIVWLVARR